MTQRLQVRTVWGPDVGSREGGLSLSGVTVSQGTEPGWDRPVFLFASLAFLGSASFCESFLLGEPPLGGQSCLGFVVVSSDPAVPEA